MKKQSEELELEEAEKNGEWQWPPPVNSTPIERELFFVLDEMVIRRKNGEFVLKERPEKLQRAILDVFSDRLVLVENGRFTEIR